VTTFLRNHFGSCNDCERQNAMVVLCVQCCMNLARSAKILSIVKSARCHCVFNVQICSYALSATRHSATTAKIPVFAELRNGIPVMNAKKCTTVKAWGFLLVSSARKIRSSATVSDKTLMSGLLHRNIHLWRVQQDILRRVQKSPTAKFVKRHSVMNAKKWYHHRKGGFPLVLRQENMVFL
jgi:hypothetical protein